MKLSHQKLKLLYLLKILMEKTDEENPITIRQIIGELNKVGISAERKSIYDDLEYLRIFGIDICVKRTKTTGYFIANRDFELPELKLLVDIVQASKFITEKKSIELISKIGKLTSRENAKKLQRQVFVLGRAKTMNENIYYNIDRIHESIGKNRQITFKYFDLDVNKKKVYRKEGNLYTESPVTLMWSNENYYLVTYKEKYESYTHYRVDRMEGIELTEDERVLSDKKFDITSYAKSTFQMFGGVERDVSIKFENSLAGVVYDHFGINVPIIKADENHFICNVRVAVSPIFLTWIIGFGNRAKILSPPDVVEALCDLIEDVQKEYN